MLLYFWDSSTYLVLASSCCHPIVELPHCCWPTGLVVRSPGTKLTTWTTTSVIVSIHQIWLGPVLKSEAGGEKFLKVQDSVSWHWQVVRPHQKNVFTMCCVFLPLSLSLRISHQILGGPILKHEVYTSSTLFSNILSYQTRLFSKYQDSWSRNPKIEHRPCVSLIRFS